MTFKKFLIATVIVLTCGAAYAADTVGLVDSQKIMFQHPRFDEASKILIFFSRALEGNYAQVLANEKDPERRQMIAKYSAQVTEFAEMDSAIAVEQEVEKKRKLWEDRQKKLSELENSLMKPILEECLQAMKAVMSLKEMTVLIELNSVYYGGTDITEEVIRQLKAVSGK